jgi:uracil-DNA glycosylase
MKNLAAAFEGLSEPTKDVIIRESKEELTKALNAIAMDEAKLTPPLPLIFEAFRKCPLETVRVCLIGQDPYPTAGIATGLSFSIPKGAKIPPSLMNIYKCLHAQGMVADPPTHGDLTYWAQQGVLLLNMALTTRVGESNAHTSWHAYTRRVIQTMCEYKNLLSFILLGNDAHELSSLIPAPHRCYKWGHPSPLARANQRECPENFINCDVFKRVNEDLKSAGEQPINWNPDGYLTAHKHAHASPATGIKPEFIAEERKIIAPFVYAPLHEPSPPAPHAWIPGAIVKTRRVEPKDPQPPTGNVLYVFTDGGAYHNGKPDCVASWACFITDGTMMTIASGLVPPRDLGLPYRTSNQRGELSAIMYALEYVTSADTFVYTEILIVSDSKYSIECIESWAPKWIAKSGKPTLHNMDKFAKYKNTDLIFPSLDYVAQLRQQYKVTLRHQAAHGTVVPADPLLRFLFKGNQHVDAMCALLLPGGDAE